MRNGVWWWAECTCVRDKTYDKAANATTTTAAAAAAAAAALTSCAVAHVGGGTATEQGVENTKVVASTVRPTPLRAKHTHVQRAQTVLAAPPPVHVDRCLVSLLGEMRRDGWEEADETLGAEAALGVVHRVELHGVCAAGGG